MTDQANNLVRFIGKIFKKQLVNKSTNEPFEKKTILLDNPNKFNADGSSNQYYSGHLVWVDAKTGANFLVKSVELAGVSDDARAKNFENSLKIDLGNKYNVENL